MVLGPIVVTSLAEMLASEQDARARRCIRDILLGFGKRGRDAVQQLLNAPNWEVRQTAAFLLREFGGTEGLPELERLLGDSEPLVQREAMRALILIGDERTYDALTRVLAAGKSRSRETLIQQLTGQRDERAIPLCTHLIRHIDHRTLSDVFLAAVETLGNIGGPETVPPLKEALYRGEWWAPFRTKALRMAAAQALARVKIPAALDVLRDAAARGPWGVKSVARTQLGRLGDAS
jgi:HEAT repeat protein